MPTPTSHNLAALLIGTGEFSMAIGATTVAAAATVGWTDFGNVVAFTPSKESTPVEHKGSYRGVRTVDNVIDTDATFMYTFKLDEFSALNLGPLFGGVPGSVTFTQAASAAAAVDTLVFAALPTKNIWWDVTKSGKRIYGFTPTSVAVGGTTLTAGVDYVHDPVLSRVKFLGTAAVTLGTYTLTGSAPAIALSTDAGYMTGTVPLTMLRKTGMGRLVCWDQAGIILDHQDFFCSVDIETSGEINGTSFTDLTAKVTIFASTPGIAYNRASVITV